MKDRINKKTAIVVGVLMVLLGGGFIGYTAYQNHQDQVAQEKAEAKAKAEARAAAEAKRKREAAITAKVKAAKAACHEALDPLLESLTDLQSQVMVGLSYNDHHDALTDAGRIYGRIKFDKLDPSCSLAVGFPAETALNKYREANNYWGDSIENFEDASETRLQSKWSQASDNLAKAEDGFVQVGKIAREEATAAS